MEDLYKCFLTRGPINQDTYVPKLDKVLKNGGRIDMNLSSIVIDDYGFGTILQMSIYYGYEKIVKCTLDNGASISEMFMLRHFNFDLDPDHVLHPWNSLELAILKYTADPNRYGNIYEMVKNKSFELYSAYGLHQLYIECAKGIWSEIEKYLLRTKTFEQTHRCWITSLAWNDSNFNSS